MRQLRCDAVALAFLGVHEVKGFAPVFAPLRAVLLAGCARDVATRPKVPVCMVLRPSADVGKSRALPFLQAPFFAGSDMTGDAGFDPLGFATEDNIDRMRECELKHGRLAMVALGGWPVAELVLGLLQRAVPPATVCTGSGCTVDSSLSAYALPLQAIGRFGAVYWASALALAIVAEVAALKRRQEWGPDLPLGDLGVDPFKLASDDMRLKELKHGRLAMAAFAVHYAGVLAKNKGVVFAHQMWSQVCVYNFRADLGFPAPICYPRPEAALDTVLSWEIMFRVLTGYFKEPYY